MPTSAFQSVEPFFIIFFGPLYAYLGKRFNSGSHTYPMKFATGLLVMSSSFLLLVLAILLTAKDGFISSWWINLSYLLQALGELFIGPIGLAMISVIAPRKMIGFFMGVWVLSSAFANYLAASFGALISGDDKVGTLVPSETIDIYMRAFGYFTLLGVIAAVILFALVPVLNKRIRFLVG